jgi:ankyrin repeat protein
LDFEDFIQVIENNNIHSVKKFLINKDFNPAEKNNKAFIRSIIYGHIDILKLLLNDKRINPANQHNQAFIYACSSLHINIIKLLLNDKRINPTDQNNNAFIRACYNGNINIVKIFIEHKIYSFNFEFDSKDENHFLKKIYPTLNKEINKYLISIEEEDLIIELQKHLISDKIFTF